MARENEQRAQKRVSTKLEVRFASTAEAARVFKTYSLNLSPGGMCIRSVRRHQPGELIWVSLLINGQKFELKARVAWSKENVMGVRFEGMSSAEKLRLESMLWPVKAMVATPPLGQTV